MININHSLQQYSKNSSIKNLPQLTDQSRGVLPNNNFNPTFGKYSDLTSNLLCNKMIQKFLKLAEENFTLFEVGVGCIIALTLRPLAIMAVPGTKKEDKKYAAVKSMASGIASIILASVLFIPLALSIKKLGKEALKNAARNNKFPYRYNSEEYRAFQYIMNTGASLLAAPLDTFLVVKFIPPLVDKIFPEKQCKKQLPLMEIKEINPQQQLLIQDFIKGAVK